jgi:hypothetical protein
MRKKFLTPEQAKSIILVKKDGMVHTFYNIPVGLIGGDHSKKSVHDDIDNAYELQLAGKAAQAMGHALAVIPRRICKQSDILFVETNMEAVKRVEKNTR